MIIDAPKIKSWVERIEALLAERADINGDIRDIYAEVKSHKHDAKAIRKLIQRRAQDEGDLAEQDALLAAYTDAIAGKIRALEAIERGASTKEAAKAGGISTGAVSGLRPRVQKARKLNGAPPHDADGVIEPQGVTGPGAAEAGTHVTSMAGSSAATISTSSKETDNGRDADDRDATGPAGWMVREDGMAENVADGNGCGEAQIQPQRHRRRGRDQDSDGRTDRENGDYPRPGSEQRRPGSGGSDHAHSDRIDVVCSGGDERAVTPVPPNAASRETADKAEILSRPAAGIHGEDGPAPFVNHPELARLLEQWKERWATMSEAERAAMIAKQRESWVRGETALGSDADEAAYRASLKAEDGPAPINESRSPDLAASAAAVAVEPTRKDGCSGDREPPNILTDDEAVAEMMAAVERLEKMKRAKGFAV